MITSTLSARSALLVTLLAISSASSSACAVPADDGAEPVAEAEQAVAVPFPGSSFTTLGSVSGYEPSGLALRSGVVYMASDNGKIAKFNTSTSSWSNVVTNSSPAPTDFESLTVATNNQLMVGIEGNSTSKIAKVDVAGGQLGTTWSLPGVGNMEAMTFVPDNYGPLGPANTVAHPSDFNGYFFVATQSNVGHIDVYRLDQGQINATWVDGYDIDITLQVSDMAFANGVLYVLFDDQNTTDLLAVYVINGNPNQSPHMLAYQKEYSLPTINGTSKNFEGIAFDGQTIYLARDHNNVSSDNGVYKFPSTLIYPQNVLPPLSW